MSSEAADWVAAHVGFEGDAFAIDGVPVWKTQWRSTASEALSLPHPAYSRQRHRFYIYEASSGDRTIVFAAGELSNGVWGFYIRG